MKNMFRHLGKRISVLLCAAMILGAAGSAFATAETTAAPAETAAAGETAAATDAGTEAATTQPAAEEKPTSGVLAGYTLEEIGSIPDGNNMSFQRGVFVIANGEAYGIMAGNGTTIEGSYYSVDDLGNNLLALRNSKEDINSTGLFTKDGEELIPCEAAIIEWVANRTGTEAGRFLKVIYGTGETENKDECFFYSTDEMFSITVGENDTMYTGYAKIYDTVTRSFVGDIQSTNPYMNAIRECGAAVAVEDTERNVTLYDATGKELLKTEKSQGIGNGYMLTYDAGQYSVIDDTGAVRYTTEEYLYDLESSSGYLNQNQNSNYVVVDKDGKQILPDMYKMVQSENAGYFIVQAVTGEYQVLDPTGKVLAQNTDYFGQICPGYFYTKVNDKYSLIGPDGVIVEGLESSAYHLLAMKDQDVFVLKDKDFTLHLDKTYANTLADGLISASSDENNKVGVFEVFTGTQLLDYEYRTVEVSGEYLYALKDDTWEVYKIVPQYR